MGESDPDDKGLGCGAVPVRSVTVGKCRDDELALGVRFVDACTSLGKMEDDEAPQFQIFDIPLGKLDGMMFAGTLAMAKTVPEASQEVATNMSNDAFMVKSSNC